MELCTVTIQKFQSQILGNIEQLLRLDVFFRIHRLHPCNVPHWRVRLPSPNV